MVDDSEPLLDGDDIQGNILPGLNRAQQFLVAFSSSDKDKLQRAIATLRPRITRLATAIKHRDDRKQAIINRASRPQRQDLWVNVALGPRATDALGAGQVRDLDQAFSTGMLPGTVGDPFVSQLPDGSPNPAHRSNWVVGAPSHPVDLLLIFAHDRDVATASEPLISAIASVLGSEPAYRGEGWLLPGEIEHFGFKDGISEPGVRGKILQDGVERLVTTRYGVPSDHDVDFGKAGQPLAWPGQFLTGQPTFAGDEPGLAPEFTNGSFLVLRRLRQDVKALYEDSETLAKLLRDKTGRQISAADLRNLLVGRFPSGAALMRHKHEPKEVEGPNEVNYFAYAATLPAFNLPDGTEVAASAADPDILHGRRCPLWAHVRKVNPRDLPTDRGGPDATRRFQMLRRGIPFGPLYDHANPTSPQNSAERGLLFLAYQRSIGEQFEQLNDDWMNNFDAPQSGGFDLLVGQNVPSDDGEFPKGLHAPKQAKFFGPLGGSTDSRGTDFVAPRQWVIPTGGAFLFAPSIAFVDRFCPPLVA